MLKSKDLCNVTLVGNLVAKPEIRYAANPVLPIADFVLASHSRWFDKTSNSFKEWTSYHPVKVVGASVEQVLALSAKGDILLLNGYLTNDKKTGKALIFAEFIQHFAKGFSQQINQITVSGKLSAVPQLITTEYDKNMAETRVTIQYQYLSPLNQQLQLATIERPVHIWGKQAEQLVQQAQGDEAVIIAGKVQYLNDLKKSQYIEAKQIILLNHEKSTNV